MSQSEYNAISIPTDTCTDLYTKQIHPAIIRCPKELVQILARVFLVVLTVSVLSLGVAGCATITEHRDGGGYTVRYNDGMSSPVPQQTKQNRYKRKYARKQHRETYIEPVAEVGPPILNLGRDDEIPVEHAKYVSSRGIMTWRARNRMCSQSQPGYCAKPNTPHCHGAFCHSHIGGGAKHTH